VFSGLVFWVPGAGDEHIGGKIGGKSDIGGKI
jgi:hypothetical protein